MPDTQSKDNTPLAVLVIVGTVLLLTLGDAAIKGFSADLRLWQIFVLRSLMVLPVLYVIQRMIVGTVRLWPKAPGWTALRSLMLSLMWVAYYTSLPHLDLSVAAAAYYTLPIFITLFSAWFVGEKVTGTGWLAVLLGFVGILVVLRPTSDNFSLYAVYPLIAAVLYAFAMILTRTKCRDEHPLILSAALNLSFILVGAAATLALWLWGGTTSPDASGGFLSPDWAALTGSSATALALMSIAILIGSIGTAIAYQIGRSSVIATFDFSYVGFATIWGIMFFGERPDILTLLGIGLIVLAGILAVSK